jgi:tetratricopeptide (TPR) repeat protein
MESRPGDINQLKPILRAAGARESDSDYWEFLLMLGFGDSAKAEQLFKSLRNTVPASDWRMPLVEIGEARILSISNRDFDCHKRLQSAAEIIFSRSNFLNEKIQAEIMALYYYVLTTHRVKFEKSLSNLPLLHMGKSLTSIQTFRMAFDYRISVSEARHLNFPITNILTIVQKLEEKELWALACIGYRSMAILLRHKSDLKSAYEYYSRALSIASQEKLVVNLKQLHVALGYAYFSEKRYDEAEAEYLKIGSEGEFDPILPILHENLALLARARSDMESCVLHMEKAIAVSTHLDSISNVPGEYLYMGQIYEHHYKKLDVAEHYYKLGYDHAMRYAGAGISLTGDRKDVVDAYVNLINKKSGPKAPKPMDTFAFSQGLAWKDIKDIFHHQLICHHQEHQQNSKAMAKKLNMPASTLYSLQERLKKRGYQLPEKNTPSPAEKHGLSTFIQEHNTLTWDDINTIFEREIIHYLYEKYGYNKQRMAQILKLSYPSIITKTRELTQVHEHLLPN